tara:strand:- start:232 stop:678 length:447 start_codon:yes stop_codon:yes gene_type:complete
MTQKEATEKIKKYCAYQDRCQSEVRKKLHIYGLLIEEIDHIICDLIEQNFINEERFAKHFVRGKFHQKNWGKIKIKQRLKQKKISDYCIKKGFQEINNEEYLEKLDLIISKKSKELSNYNDFIKKQKIAKYAISKGYENHLVWDSLKV